MTKKPLNIIGMGNAAVDCLLHVPEALLAEFNLKKGDFHQTDKLEDIERIIEKYGPGELVSGGSVANTIDALARLGVKSHFIGLVGDDQAGNKFYNDFKASNVGMAAPQKTATSMTILCLITPDGQRTFLSLGCLSCMDEAFVAAEPIAQAQWLLIEGYLLFDQPNAVHEAIKIARENGTKVGFTLASIAVLNFAWAALSKVLAQDLDLLFANDEEIVALFQAVEKHQHNMAEEMAISIHHMPHIITQGGEGATYLDGKGNKTFVGCEEISPRDTTGAGDAFAAGFLFGQFSGDSIEESLARGHVLGRRAIQQIGGRLAEVK